jgi:Glycosyltransferase family 17
VRAWDTFIFNDELDMLECRLAELEKSIVYRHVLVEAPVTHRGRPKPLHYTENKDRFTAWAGKIIHVVAPELPRGPNPWVREHTQREYSRRGLGDAAPGDLILHGDADEIPAPAAVAAASDILHDPEFQREYKPPIVAFEQRIAQFAVDWLHPGSWHGTMGALLRDVTGFQWMRGQRRDQVFRIKDGGWHLGWLGGPEAITRKMAAYCHLEMDKEISEGNAAGKYYERGRFWGWGEGEIQLQPADVDETWPKWVYERRCPVSWFRPREGAQW